MRLIALIPILFSLVACTNPPPAEESCNFVQNSFKRRVSWARTPIKFYADKTITDEQYKGVLDAMEVWNQEFDRPVFELIGRTGDTKGLPAPRLNAEGRVISDGYNGIYRVEKAVFANTSEKDEQARTSISYRGDFIYEADILIDGSEQFYYQDLATQASDKKIQFKSLLIHELGHVLGLGHVEIAGVESVMYPKLQFGQLRNELGDIDRDSLACEYQ